MSTTLKPLSERAKDFAKNYKNGPHVRIAIGVYPDERRYSFSIAGLFSNPAMYTAKYKQGDTSQKLYFRALLSALRSIPPHRSTAMMAEQDSDIIRVQVTAFNTKFTRALDEFEDTGELPANDDPTMMALMVALQDIVGRLNVSFESNHVESFNKAMGTLSTFVRVAREFDKDPDVTEARMHQLMPKSAVADLYPGLRENAFNAVA